ncbi:hypothetical protein SNOG_07245 [Parastagonospora nodorum SN15]|uniref:Uncharacterized protein n=1 Tax=Phaeosphaeria nodorum (strain SN15 / ATCC MYA-4574 / FGSC 10173) TaxID=321614 RepID=Q0ULW9_PHANO|nr:hypothetical protein SNOG_07245 [Parastagonospora nodorum SN15]EAT85896.1 hypothetical protein SNOG_07245 [Parastagonospora nodorum SN15]
MPPFWTIGTLFGASSVMLGAFGAHGLKKRIADPARIANWGTAAQYQREHIPAGVGSALVQVSGAGDATWWVVLDWGVGGAGGEGQAGYGVGEVQIEKV